MSSSATRKLKGFQALGGEVPYLDANAVRIVGLDIEATPDNWFAHCARLKDETDEDLAGYVADILRDGSSTKIVKGYRDGDFVNVLDGRRTTRATRLAYAQQAKQRVPLVERVKIRVSIHKDTPKNLFRINVESHKAKPLNPMQHAQTVLTYYHQVAEDKGEVAAFFGLSATIVKRTLALFDCDADLQRAVAGGFPITEAIKLSALPRADQKRILAELPREGKAARGLKVRARVAEATGIPRVASRKVLLGVWAALKDELDPRLAFAGAVIARLAGDTTVLADSRFDCVRDKIDAAWAQAARPGRRKESREVGEAGEASETNT